MIPALALRAVRKSYGDRVAVASLDLEVAPGELFGLLGPNGAVTRWEVYTTNPITTPNPAAQQTRIIAPLRQRDGS